MTLPPEASLIDVVRSTAIASAGRFDASVAWELGTAVSEATTEIFRLASDRSQVGDAHVEIRVESDVHVRIEGGHVFDAWPPEAWAESLTGVILRRLTTSLDAGSTGRDDGAAFISFTVSGA